MRTEFPRIHTGSRDDCLSPQGLERRFGDADVAMVHACKTCHKREFGQPKPDADTYLTSEAGDGGLYLNLIDPDVPLFRRELFEQFLAWVEPRYRAGDVVLIHCDKGESRSRSLALLLAARVGLVPSGSYEAAAAAFGQREPFTPSRGIELFLAQNWRALVPPAVRAPARPAWAAAAVAKREICSAIVTTATPKTIECNAISITPAQFAAAWTPTAKDRAKEAEERAKYDGWTLREIDEIAEDPEKWARIYGRIPDLVTREPLRFVPRPLQRRMFRQYRACSREGKPCREIVCKIRRGGGSSAAECILYVHAHNNMAHLGAIGTTHPVSMNMFRDYQQFFNATDTFPGWKKAAKTLETGYLDWSNGSKWQCYTADNPEAARSAGLQGYHATECARWMSTMQTDAAETLQSMLGAVPKRGFTVVIEESTAKGGSGAFFNRFMGGRWPTAAELNVPEGQEFWRQWADEIPQNIDPNVGDIQFVRLFAGWYEDDENRPENGVTQEQAARIEATLDAKELELIRRYRTMGPQGPRLGREVTKATLWEQLAWRRAVINGPDFEGDEAFFEQEFPSSPSEAFASSGKHSFNRAGCSWMVETAKVRKPTIGVLEQQQDGHVTFRRTGADEAWFHMWEEPRIGCRYVEGVDTMSGKSNVKNAEEADYHGAVVVRAPFVDQTNTFVKMPPRVVGALMPRCQWEPDMLAVKTHLMSLFYGGCMITFEVNNTGHAYKQEAVRLGANLYRRENTDKFTNVVTEHVGWETNPQTRPQIIGTLKKAIRNNAKVETREDGVECWSEPTAKELQACILGDDGKDQAPPGGHDDHMMALGFALQTIDGATYYAGRRRRRQGPADRAAWSKFGGAR